MVGDKKIGIVIVLVILMVHSHSKIIVAQLFNVVEDERIVIGNKFKNNDIMISNKTRQLAMSTLSFKDMAQIPSIKVEYEGMMKKWMHIKGDTSVYLFKTLLHISQLQTALNGARNDEGSIVLLEKRYEAEGDQAVNMKNVCFFMQQDLKDQNIRTFLQKCLQNHIKQATTEDILVPNTEIESNSTIIVLALLFPMMSFSKLLYFWWVSSQESVV